MAGIGAMGTVISVDTGFYLDAFKPRRLSNGKLYIHRQRLSHASFLTLTDPSVSASSDVTFDYAFLDYAETER